MKDQFIQCGETVMCRDNQDVETLVKKNEFYLVKEVSHRGALLKVAGVPATLAATRFTPVRLIPPAQEVAVGSE